MGPERYVAVTFLGLAALVGAIGNTLVIASVGKFKKLRTKTNAFVLNLAVCDLMNNLFAATSHCFSLAVDGPSPLCGAAAAIQSLTLQVSLLSIAAIAINRLVMITCKQTTSQKLFSKINISITICLLWIVSCVQILPGLVGFEAFGYSRPKGLCSFLIAKTRENIALRTSMTLTCMVLPCVVITCCYSRLLLFLRRRAAIAGQAAKARREMKVTVSLLLVFVSFAICNLPAFSVFVIVGLSFTRIPRGYLLFSAIFLKLNFCVNPLIYAWRNEDFKQAFLGILLAWRAKNQVGPQTSTEGTGTNDPTGVKAGTSSDTCNS